MISKKYIVPMVVLSISILVIFCCIVYGTAAVVWAKPSYLNAQTSNLYFFNISPFGKKELVVSTEDVEIEVEAEAIEPEPEPNAEILTDASDEMTDEVSDESVADTFDTQDDSVVSEEITPEPEKVYDDIETHWAKRSILFMMGMNLLEPVDETSFAPNEIITRAEFVSILGTHAGIPAELPAMYSFFDVKVDEPYAPHVYWATQNKIISGVSDDLFLPDDPLTREQMATILVRYTDMMNFKLPVLHERVEFSDSTLISYWAKSSVFALQTSGLLVGNTTGGVNPKGMLTRAEISVVLEKFIVLTNQYGYDL